MGKINCEKLVEDLDTAIELDQIYVCRDILEQLDEHQTKPSVQKYYEENKDKLQETRENIDKIGELLGSLKSTEGWTKCKEKR